MIPREKTSTLELPSFSRWISGAIYNGVPLVEIFSSVSTLAMGLARPKSAILKFPLWIRIFSGLISRWMIDFS